MVRRVLVAALLPLLLAGCGGESDGDAEVSATDNAAAASPASTGSASEDASTAESAAAVGGQVTEADKAAIEETMVAFLMEPRCDLATEEYLVELALFDDVTPQEACDQWTQSFVDPLFTEEDIVISDIQGRDGVATLKVGSELVDITTVYELTLVDGTWLVSGDEFNSDHL